MGPGGRLAGRSWSISLARMRTIHWMRKDLDISLAQIPQGRGIAEGVGSFVVSKPPAQWTAAAEARAIYDIEVLSAIFRRVEATAFASGEYEPHANAVRLGLINDDRSEVAKVVRIREEDEAAVGELAAKLEQVLGEVSTLKLAAISRILWKSLKDDAQGREPIPPSDSSQLSDLAGKVP